MILASTISLCDNKTSIPKTKNRVLRAAGFVSSLNRKRNYIMDEQWKAIKGYEGLYEVSNLGNVRTCYNGKMHEHPASAGAEREE